MTTTATAPTQGRPPEDRPARRSWRGAVVLVLALLWIYGLGSLLAVALTVTWRHRTVGPRDRALLRAGGALGALGALVTVAGTALLAGASAS